jgi:nicotinate-nucleotide adenylyltransferase
VTFSASPNLPEPLGVFGGTFDPVHFGHLRLAEEAIGHLGLAGVRWIPAGSPPHREPPRAGPQARLEMVLRSTAGNPRFSVDAGEVAAKVPSYTVHTLERLRAESGGDCPLVLLVGADAFAGLETWHCWRDIFALAHLGVAYRPGFPIDGEALPPALAAEFSARRQRDPLALRETAAGGIASFAMTPLGVSGTQVRQLLAAARSARYLVPDEVLDYIELHQLYKTP